MESPARSIRIWPAIVIVVGQLLAPLVIAALGATTLGDVWGSLFAPLIAVGLLTAWWLFASRAPVADRFCGFWLWVYVLAWYFAMHKPIDAFMVAMRAVPFLTTGLIVSLIILKEVPWEKRRWCVMGVLLSITAIFSMLRVEGMHGNLVPDLAWRWSEAPLQTVSEDVQGTAAVPATASAEDWPAFRGPEGDAILTGVSFGTDWNANPPEELWRKTVGIGWSSFCVVGDYLFTQEQRGEDEIVVCYEADTGEEVWVQSQPVHFEDMMGAGPRATPTFVDGKLYTYGVTGILQCLDAATGKVVWTRAAAKESGASLPTWGYASSPLILDGKVIVFTSGGSGKGVGAYDINTGDLVWYGGDGRHGYATVQLSTLDGVDQLLIASNLGMQSLSPDDGVLLWEHQWPVKNNPRVVQPMVIDATHVLLGTAAGMGTRSLAVTQEGDAWKVEEVWTARHFRPYFNDYVQYGGYCYGYDGNRMACIDPETGEEMWRADRLGGQVLLLKDMAMLLVFSEEGEVLLVEASPESFTIVASMDGLDGKTWNHPVVNRGRLYLKNSKEMACYVLPE